jgi:hypothetical protein
MPTSPELDDPWRSATWKGAEESVLTVGARMSLPERLRWLEQAAACARALAGERSPRAASACDARSQLSRSPASGATHPR